MIARLTHWAAIACGAMAALMLAGCGERPQVIEYKQGKYQGKPDQPPYKAPPQAPVLYIKPANTFSANGTTIALPVGVTEVEIGATVGMVMQSATEIAGYVLMNDLSIPHDSFFRPPVKFKCLDGFLCIGDRVRARNEAGDPAIFVLQVRINDELKQTVGDPLVRRPRHAGSLDLTWAHGRLAAFSTFRVRGSVLDVEPSFGSFGGLFTAPGFAVLDGGASWQVTRQVTAFARGLNLLDRAYEEAFGYPSPGRLGMVGVRVDLRP